MKLVRAALSLLLLSGATLSAEDLAPEIQARFVKAMAQGSGQSHIRCSDPAMKSALEAQGMTVDSASPMIWTNSPAEARMAKATGILVVSGRRDMIVNAAVVIQGDGGRPKFIVNAGNLRGCRIQLGDSIMRVSEKS
jgi:hypothetical protein